jgi:hypothetical protein
VSAPVDLTNEERAALVAILTTEIEASRFQLSPRITMLNRLRAKLLGEAVATRQEPARSGLTGCQKGVDFTDHFSSAYRLG